MSLPPCPPDPYCLAENACAAITQAVAAAGICQTDLTPADLVELDEFHLGGAAATLKLVAQFDLPENAKLLDIGAGLGGPARLIAQNHSYYVHGVDITPGFVAAAEMLSDWTGFTTRTSFSIGDATALPFAAESFDGAYSFHLGMNIANKAALCAEAYRLLKPGGTFLSYDILQGPGGEVLYPTPWADLAAQSYVVSPEVMEQHLTGAGFEILTRIDRTAENLAWMQSLVQRPKEHRPKLTLATVMGPDFIEKSRMQMRNLKEGRIQTIAYLCRK
ncbi:MAG: class I SAM-dependent methyltransferase [Mangrovicoccus sp.]